jgi:hypothetical protein
MPGPDGWRGQIERVVAAAPFPAAEQQFLALAIQVLPLAGGFNDFPSIINDPFGPTEQQFLALAIQVLPLAGGFNDFPSIINDPFGPTEQQFSAHTLRPRFR